MILVFGGTTEGKQVAALLEELQHTYLYSTKASTKSVVKNTGVQVQGALDEHQMANLCQDKNIRLIIDAAHPFAVVLHKTIFNVSCALNTPLARFERKEEARMAHPLVHYVASYDEAIAALRRIGSPTLLALSGVQSIPYLSGYWKKTVTWSRILDRAGSVALAAHHQFPKERLILGYPSAHVEEEEALYRRLKIGAVLTKESGNSGGLMVKMKAATSAGIPIFVIKKPKLPAYDLVVNDTGELRQVLSKMGCL